jgi:hypothetical protein
VQAAKAGDKMIHLHTLLSTLILEPGNFYSRELSNSPGRIFWSCVGILAGIMGYIFFPLVWFLFRMWTAPTCARIKYAQDAAKYHERVAAEYWETIVRLKARKEREKTEATETIEAVQEAV